jgi:hypothetical protein
METKEVEVTEEMKNAGAAVLKQYGFLDSALPSGPDLLVVQKIYLAMLEARHDKKC